MFAKDALGQVSMQIEIIYQNEDFIATFVDQHNYLSLR